MSEPDLRMLRLAAVLMKKAMASNTPNENLKVMANYIGRSTKANRYNDITAQGRARPSRIELFDTAVGTWLEMILELPDSQPPNKETPDA